MAMQRHAADDLQSGIPEHLPEDTSPGRGHLMPAASLTGDLVERGRKSPGPQEGASPVEYPVPVEPQIPQIEVLEPGPAPGPAEVASAVTPVGENIQVFAAKETGDGEMAAMARTYNWFNLFRNAVLFIVVFWLGAFIAAMAFGN